jgi:hypothetical protein
MYSKTIMATFLTIAAIAATSTSLSTAAYAQSDKAFEDEDGNDRGLCTADKKIHDNAPDKTDDNFHDSEAGEDVPKFIDKCDHLP